MNLLEAMLNAPLTAMRLRWPDVLHAVDMDELAHAWPGKRPSGRVPTRLPRSVCGVAGVRLLQMGTTPVLWPPPARPLPNDATRCRACWEATGRKRPRSRFVAREGS